MHEGTEVLSFDILFRYSYNKIFGGPSTHQHLFNIF